MTRHVTYVISAVRLMFARPNWLLRFRACGKLFFTLNSG